MILSIDESINRLKAEIIAQDWSLSQKRIDLLEAAFICLKNRFNNRKSAFAILTMADSVLDYVKKKGENNPTVTIDFLKEAMAHIVSLYEEGAFDPEKEEKIFRGLYSRFVSLKKKIQASKHSAPAEDVAPLNRLAAVQTVKVESNRDDNEFSSTALLQFSQKVLALRIQTDQEPDHQVIDRLIHELQMSLQQADEVGATIRDLLAELLAVPANSEVASISKTGDPPPVLEESCEVEAEPVVEVKRRQEIRICPSTELREIILGETPVYIRDSCIAMIRDLDEGKRKTYLKNSNVPLKDFSRFLQNLAKQFKGPLARIQDKKLKKLILPVMVPTGLDLPELVDENGTKMVVITNGQWNGVLICAAVHDETRTMVKFKKAINGDIAGMGYSEEGIEFPLLNVVSVLRREGFLTMV